MVFGHVAAGLVAKKTAPRVSLGVLLVAAEALDILWGLFLLTGVEHLPPLSPRGARHEHGQWGYDGYQSNLSV